MFRKMRRHRQSLPEEECAAILRAGSAGVLSLLGDDGYPYGVPLSYVYDGGDIYFHCAKEGHKIDAVKSCDRASFCVIARDDVISEEYTTYFESVIVFGRISVVCCEEEKRRAVESLAVKYAPDSAEEDRKRAIEREWAAVCVLKLSPEHISGKRAIELVK